MIEQITTYFLLFITCAFAGWLIEEFYAIFIAKKKTNRGFLVGPLCPMYGFAAVFMRLTLERFENNIFIVFGLSVIMSAIIEFTTGCVLKKVFNIKLWDYSNTNSKFTVGEILSIETLLAFGGLGLFFIKILNPLLKMFFGLFKMRTLEAVSIVIAIFLIIDFVYSIMLYHHIGKEEENDGDITDKKNAKVKKHLNETNAKVKEQINVANTNVKKTINAANNNVKKQIKKTNDIVKSKLKKSN